MFRLSTRYLASIFNTQNARTMAHPAVLIASAPLNYLHETRPRDNTDRPGTHPDHPPDVRGGTCVRAAPRQSQEEQAEFHRRSIEKLNARCARSLRTGSTKSPWLSWTGRSRNRHTIETFPSGAKNRHRSASGSSVMKSRVCNVRKVGNDRVEQRRLHPTGSSCEHLIGSRGHAFRFDRENRAPILQGGCSEGSGLRRRSRGRTSGTRSP